MRVLITGAAGSIGSEIVRQLSPRHKIYCLDINEVGVYDLVEELKLKGYAIDGRVGDIRDQRTVEDVFSDFKPEIVYHAAAYKVVPAMELVPLEAIQTNIIGTHNVLHASKRWKVKKFVFISTDKVISSASVMGATKRVGEIMVKNSGKGYVAVRFANVMGSRGSVIPLWENQIARGEPMTITDERMERYMMTIPQAVNLVIKAGELGKGGELFILDMGKPVKILDLAKSIVERLGGNVTMKTIGIRPGETLTERLMTEEEERTALKMKDFYVIK